MEIDKNDQVMDDAFNALSPEELLLTGWNLDISMRLHELLDAQGMNPSDLAVLMGKEESEVRRYLKGMHHLSIETIAGLQMALKAPLFGVPFKTE